MVKIIAISKLLVEEEGLSYTGWNVGLGNTV
jgi:hypothetical protein